MKNGKMKITKRQLIRIIRENILNEILPPGHPVPRSVQADYDIANKEDTFPDTMQPKSTAGLPKVTGPQPSKKKVQGFLKDLNLISDRNITAKDIVSITPWEGPGGIWRSGEQWDIIYNSGFNPKRRVLFQPGAREYGEWENGQWEMWDF